MAAMQAQVEPHFLFNTLASIEHLIETDRQARRRTMQRNLIALLRASMPTMREAGDGALRDLGRELAGDPALPGDPEGAHGRPPGHRASTCPRACCRPSSRSMMIQTPGGERHQARPGAQARGRHAHREGRDRARQARRERGRHRPGLRHGRPPAGTGVGLANIRERLQMLYGGKATLAVAAHPPGGTVVTITVPYRSLEGASARPPSNPPCRQHPCSTRRPGVRAIAARRPAQAVARAGWCSGCCWRARPGAARGPRAHGPSELDEPVRVYVDGEQVIQRPRAARQLALRRGVRDASSGAGARGCCSRSVLVPLAVGRGAALPWPWSSCWSWCSALGLPVLAGAGWWPRCCCRQA
jgi:hypothetical protein